MRPTNVELGIYSRLVRKDINRPRCLQCTACKTSADCPQLKSSCKNVVCAGPFSPIPYTCVVVFAVRPAQPLYDERVLFFRYCISTRTAVYWLCICTYMCIHMLDICKYVHVHVSIEVILHMKFAMSACIRCLLPARRRVHSI